MARIDILIHAADNFRPEYFLYRCMEVWNEAGHDVRVTAGPEGPMTADLVILHVDQTRVPVPYLARVRQYPKAINGYVADISKRVVSRNLVNRNDPYEGPVIVKTDLNCGGSQEAYLASLGLGPEIPNWGYQNYQILDSLEQVPDSIWRSRDWVVERYLPEIVDGFFCLRTWSFLGTKWTHNRSYSHERIVKGNTTVKRENMGEIPDELMALREELAFDYGKFDYAMVDGKVVLYDANRTPTLGIFTREEYMPRIRLLAEGLEQFL